MRPKDQPQIEPAQRRGKAMVFLERNRYGHYLATGRINGRGLEFVLDTGASDVSVPAHLAQQLGLRRGPALVYKAANGDISAYLTTIEQVQPRDINLEQVRASFNPATRSQPVVLGMSFLKSLDFSRQGDTLTLRQRP